MPITMKAIRIEKATLISTTSGMPLAPVAASTSPFSSDMKPTTWLTALRRVTMTRSPSSTTDKAKARSSRASGSASLVTRSIRTMERATSAIPASMVGPIPTANSMSRWIPSCLTMRCSATGMMIALKTRAIPCRDVEMGRVLNIGLPGDRKREHYGMERKDVEQRIKPVLVQHHETDQDQPASERMRDVKGEAVHLHQKLFDTNRRRVPSRPSMRAAPRNCGTRKTRIFAVAVSNSARKKPAAASLTR